MERPIRLAIAGFGKIARDQHWPAIIRTPGIELVAVADPRGGPAGLAGFASLQAMLDGGPAIDAVALCTPPQHRRALAEACLRAGKHVLLEKPPGATVGELGPLAALAERSGLTLFAAWHSRFAPAVAPARLLLAEAALRRVAIVWKEDVRVWHPGQDWIWEPGGLGVFDPGINALSILTAILPRPPFLTGATLEIPADRAAPIAAALTLSDANGVPIEAAFDWRQTGKQVWTITAETDRGVLTLADGGAALTLEGAAVAIGAAAEYPALYAHFVGLIGQRARDLDALPLVLVADAFLLGHRRVVEAFGDA